MSCTYVKAPLTNHSLLDVRYLRGSEAAPLLVGRSPVDYLTRMGTAGYVSLVRQVRRWAEM